MSEVKAGSRRDRYAALTRQAILDAARELFVERGFAGTSVSDIAVAAETSKGAVYHHFADKEAIFIEVFRSAQTAVAERAAQTLTVPVSVWDGFEAGNRAMLRTYGTDREARTLLRGALTVLGWDRVRKIDVEFGLPIIRRSLEQLISAGEIVDVPVETTANLLLSLYCDAVVLVADADDPAKVLDELEEVITRLILGLRAG
jgi:AcrR family transcriptional regulator